MLTIRIIKPYLAAPRLITRAVTMMIVPTRATASRVCVTRAWYVRNLGPLALFPGLTHDHRMEKTGQNGIHGFVRGSSAE